MFTEKRFRVLLCSLLSAIALPVAAKANLLTNSGFEIGSDVNADSWTLWDGTHLEAWAAQSGSNGLAFYGWTTGGGAYQDVYAHGASNYTFSVSGFRDTNFTVGGLVLKMEFMNAAGVTIGSELHGITSESAVSQGTWRVYSMTVPSPSSTARIRAVLAFSGPAGTGGAFKWDDASLNSAPYTIETNTHYVSQGGTGIYPYTNWQTAAHSVVAAVGAAHAGDTILIATGLYSSTDTILVDFPALIRSTGSATNTTVSGANACRVFYVTDPGVTIQGLTITNGRSAVVNSNSFGGGVCFVNGGVLRDCIVLNNLASGVPPSGGTGYARGGGVYCAVTGRIENCIIAGNSASGGSSSGGGLYCAGNILVTNCDLFQNSSIGGINFFYYGQGGAGGGLVALNGAQIYNCRISNNVAQGQSSMYPGGSIGAGLYCASATVSRCVIARNLGISGNYASRGDSWACGAGAYLTGGAVLENCLVLNNTATGIYVYADAFGGGVYAYGSAEIRSCTIAGNRAHAGYYSDSYGGGGVYATYGPILRNTIIDGNSADGRGPDNWYAYSNVTISHCCAFPIVPSNGNISASARLTDIAGGNPHLLADSPCIDRADNATAPALDFDGGTRPLDGNSDGLARADIGACEAAAATTTPNLLLNGTFETPSAWILIDDTRLEGWAARSGTNGLAHYGWTDGGIAWQDIQAVGTSNYTFSVWGFRDTDFSAGLSVEMKIEFLSDTLAPLVVTQQYLTGSAAWATYSISGISPPDTKIVRVVLAFSGTPGAGGAFKWDDAVLLSTEALFNARYVAAGGGNIYPYTNWVGAATNLQAAVGAAQPDDTILVSNGTYLGEVVINKSLSIRGLGGVVLTGKAAYPFTNELRAMSVSTGCVLDLRNVTIRNGFSQTGGGILNYGTLVLKDSGVLSNEANLIYGYGGGLYNAGTATLERCTFSFNKAHGDGTPSAGTGYGAGIYCANGSILTATDCALVANRAYGTINYDSRDGGSGYGGAIYNNGGTVTLTSSTLGTNSATGAWAGYNGGHGMGGAIYAKGTTTIRSCTVVDNVAQQGGATMGGPYLGYGGGIYIDSGAAVSIDNTIIARNTASTEGPDCRGAITAAGRNLLGSGSNCTISGASADVIIAADPGLTGLGLNGGTTPTCIPLFGSPVIDQGSSNGVPSFDQLGTVRPIDGSFDGQAQADIGACEYNPQTTDSDHDSLFDSDEVLVHHSNPAVLDSDGDGMGDAYEVRAGTSPTNSASLFGVESQNAAGWNGQGIVVRWSSSGGKSYTVLRTTNVMTGFTVLESGVFAVPPENVYTDATATAEGPYFYRVQLE